MQSGAKSTIMHFSFMYLVPCVQQFVVPYPMSRHLAWPLLHRHPHIMLEKETDVCGLYSREYRNIQKHDEVPDKCCCKFPLAMNSYINTSFLESLQNPLRETKFPWWTVVKTSTCNIMNVIFILIFLKQDILFQMLLHQ